MVKIKELIEYAWIDMRINGIIIKMEGLKVDSIILWNKVEIIKRR